MQIESTTIPEGLRREAATAIATGDEEAFIGRLIARPPRSAVPVLRALLLVRAPDLGSEAFAAAELARTPEELRRAFVRARAEGQGAADWRGTLAFLADWLIADAREAAR